uniref:Uncharacterized protein n=1 Tax=viral metagenome TaxID=1070528 RepID=A0A6H1Z7Y2_9ZZZZ
MLTILMTGETPAVGVFHTLAGASKNLIEIAAGTLRVKYIDGKIVGRDYSQAGGYYSPPRVEDHGQLVGHLQLGGYTCEGLMHDGRMLLSVAYAPGDIVVEVRCSDPEEAEPFFAVSVRDLGDPLDEPEIDNPGVNW